MLLLTVGAEGLSEPCAAVAQLSLACQPVTDSWVVEQEHMLAISVYATGQSSQLFYVSAI